MDLTTSVDGLTTTETVAVSAIAGTFLASFVIFGIIFYVLLVIALWKIFTKAGEEGWKSLIPIYNCYILYKISGLSFLYWFVIPVVGASILSGVANSVSSEPVKYILLIVAYVTEIVIYAKFCSALAKAFGKGTGFAVGLFFLPNIFQLILGFGSAKYVGNKN